jgi:hypothetical protein
MDEKVRGEYSSLIFFGPAAEAVWSSRFQDLKICDALVNCHFFRSVNYILRGHCGLIVSPHTFFASACLSLDTLLLRCQSHFF